MPALVALLVLPLVAFGGRAAWAAWTLGAGSLVYAAAVRVRIGGPLDRALLLLVGALAIQILPVPTPLLDLLSPHAQSARRALALAPQPGGGIHTVSVDAGATLWAAVVLIGAFGLFWAARAQFAAGGLRLTARAIASTGLAVSLLAIAQAATAGRRIYWTFPTEVQGPLPFGPFVNRNHFATWVVMALPLTFGYIAAHARAHAARATAPVHPRARIAHAVDPRTAWLALAATLMLVALLLSLSRSGALALGLSAMAALWATRRSIDARQWRWCVAGVMGLSLFALLWSDLPAIADRLAGARTGLADRLTIWRDTLPVVRDFPLTGTGAGTYQIVMVVYQKANRAVYFNQAHNHYLQVAAEGGLLLVVPTCLALVALVRTAFRRIADDQSALRWIRVGAATGLGAVALQSVWETGLVMPANAALAAVLAAVLVHARHDG
jgi:O-antigen ligase